MENSASDLAQRLSHEAETVCRHYLSNGRRQGRYWIVGDVENAPGRSLYVRLTGPSSGKGAAGKWTDAATGEHGDLLDLIAANLRLATLGETLDEARRFLSMPRPEPPQPEPLAKVPTGSPEAARRLWAMGKPIAGTLAERYLAGRGIVGVRTVSTLRFHPNCYYWCEDRTDKGRPEAWPALLAKVTDADGNITGLHRTWLDPETVNKAPLDPNRKAIGTKIAFAGGTDVADHTAIWAALDKVHAKHADMVLLHGGSPKGAEKIAACWADNRKCPQIVFKPDWTRHSKAAPFKRNDQLLDTAPIGLIVFPGSGITDNLADKARQMGVPLYDFRPRKAGAL